jgi:hypothetical protein
MAESTRNLTGLGGEAAKEEDDEYMGDLSQFIPQELSQTSKRKVSSGQNFHLLMSTIVKLLNPNLSN